MKRKGPYARVNRTLSQLPYVVARSRSGLLSLSPATCNTPVAEISILLVRPSTRGNRTATNIVGAASTVVASTKRKPSKGHQPSERYFLVLIQLDAWFAVISSACFHPKMVGCETTANKASFWFIHLTKNDMEAFRACWSRVLRPSFYDRRTRQIHTILELLKINQGNTIQFQIRYHAARVLS